LAHGVESIMVRRYTLPECLAKFLAAATSDRNAPGGETGAFSATR
jgi:hypothetical protein